MARLITKAELEQKIVELAKAAALMTHKDHRVCETCLVLYHEDSRDKQCYCDYESDRRYD